MQVNIKNLIDDSQCYQTVRELRWPDGITCPSCQSTQVIKRGCDDTESAHQRYACTDCHSVTLLNEVECDEAYVIAGHKGQPEVVQIKGRTGRRHRLKGQGGRGTLKQEGLPVFGMARRGGTWWRGVAGFRQLHAVMPIRCRQTAWLPGYFM